MGTPRGQRATGVAVLLLGGIAGLLGGGACSSPSPVLEPPADTAPAEPVEPTLPQLANWSCPNGWEVRPGLTDALGQPDVPDGMAPFSICLPPAQQACAAGEAQFLGEAGCAPLGHSCPDAPFLAESEIRALAPGFTGSIFYVDPRSASGDGSRAAPLATIQAALALAAAGDTIALANTRFDEFVAVDAAVAIVGACVAGTQISAAAPSNSAGVVTFGRRAGGSLLANLRVSGGRPGLWIASDPPAVALEALEVRDALGAGIVVVRATSVVEAAEFVVRDTAAGDADPASGLGLALVAGRLECRRCLFERNYFLGAAVEDGATALFEDLVVRDTAGRSWDLRFGRGLTVSDGGQVVLRRALLERNREVGLRVSGVGSTLEGSDLVVRETRGRESDGAFGRGLEVGGGAEATLARVILEGNREAGLVAQGEGVMLTASDILVRDTEAQQSDGRFGVGLDVRDGAAATLERVVLERNRCFGLSAFTTGTELALRDVMSRDTRAEAATGDFGIGLTAELGASAQVERALILRNRATGVNVANTGTVVTLTDIVVEGTESDETTARPGRGINVQLGGTATIQRAALTANREVGLFVGGQAARAVATDIVIRGTRPAACEAIPRGDARYCVVDGVSYGVGSAVVVLGLASVEIRHFVLAQSSLAGLQLVQGEADLYDGEVADNPIGVNLQTEGYDIARLQNEVRYRNNDRTLDADALPVPAIMQSLP